MGKLENKEESSNIVNPFQMTTEELAHVGNDMTKELFNDWSNGSDAVSTSAFLNNFQEMIDIGLISESRMKEIFLKHGATNNNDMEESDFMNYKQFSACFREINDICFAEADQEIVNDFLSSEQT